MQNIINLNKRAMTAILVVAMLITFNVLLSVLPFSKVSAAQLTQRKITISSSHISQTSVTYAVSFRVTQTTVIRGVVVDICQNSPLIGASCTTTNGVTSTPDSPTTVTFTNTGSSGDATFETHANSTGTGLIIYTDSDGATGGDGFTPTTGNDFTFSFTATNPSGTASTAGAPGTFYARMLTYSTAADAASYTSSAPGSNRLDEGGVALSTARRLTVNARVQEELEFCVGVVAGTVDTDAEAPANCQAAAFSGTTPTVDIGVVSSSASSLSPVAATAGGNDVNGAVLVRTNAFNGANVTYFAEQETSSGRLKVTGATCSGSTAGFDTGSSSVDQCFNSNADDDSANNTLTSATEKFGMSISHVLRPTGSTTTNLSPTEDYTGAATPTQVAWQSSGATTSIASSSTVLDYEMLLLRFAARAAATTPTGFYTNLSTYVATGTF